MTSDVLPVSETKLKEALGDHPKVSVVISTLNEGRYIAEVIESALNQKYPNLEIHIQDGGSVDDTLEIVRRYPIQCASEPDNGVPDAFNKGFLATSGEIMIFTDDPMLPGSIQTLVEALSRNPEAAFAYGDAEYIDASGKPFFYHRSRTFDLDDLFWSNYIPAQSVAVRRTAVASVGMYREGIITADWDLWLRLGARYAAVYVPRALGRYRVHSGSTTLKNIGKFGESICWISESVLSDAVVKSALRHSENRAWAGSHLWAVPHFVLAGERLRPAKLYFRAIRRYPPALLTRRGAGALLALSLGARLYQHVFSRGRASA